MKYAPLFVFALWALAVCGWIANVVKLLETGFAVAQWGGLEVARAIGVAVAPLGAMLGFF